MTEKLLTFAKSYPRFKDVCSARASSNSSGASDLLSSLSISADSVAEWLRRISAATLLMSLFFAPLRPLPAVQRLCLPLPAEKTRRTGLSSILAGFGPRSSALTPSAAPRRRRRRLLSFLVENGGSNALCLGLLPSHLFGISAAVIVSLTREEPTLLSSLARRLFWSLRTFHLVGGGDRSCFPSRKLTSSYPLAHHHHILCSHRFSVPASDREDPTIDRRPRRHPRPTQVE